MGNFYTKNTSKEEKLNELKPKRETINFLLNYSRALNVTTYQSMKFETFLN